MLLGVADGPEDIDGSVDDTPVGTVEEFILGSKVGWLLGVVDGTVDGLFDDMVLGNIDGDIDGSSLGVIEGMLLGRLVGTLDVTTLGIVEGILLGIFDDDGIIDGILLGLELGHEDINILITNVLSESSNVTTCTSADPICILALVSITTDPEYVPI